MNCFNLKSKIFIVLTLAITLPLYCIADEAGQAEDSTTRNSRFVEDRNPSAATFDKRLPPVIPGEEISDGKDRMNVWSTSGSLTANEPPAPSRPQEFDSNRQRPSIGVIVDQRDPRAHGEPVERPNRR